MIMAEETDAAKFSDDSKKLAIAIYDFLLEERCKKNLTSFSKDNIDKATDALEKVYNIRFTDYILLKKFYTLTEIYEFGRYPVPIKNKLAADLRKRSGNNYMDQRQYELAHSEYTKAIRLDSRNAIYFCNRAAARIRLRKYLDALSDCEKALELDRNYVKAYGWMGIAHALMENPAKAIRCYRKALRIEPENKICIENMDLINKKMNHISFRVMEPWHTCKRGLARFVNKMAKYQTLFHDKTRGDTDENVKENKSDILPIEYFILGDLD